MNDLTASPFGSLWGLVSREHGRGRILVAVSALSLGVALFIGPPWPNRGPVGIVTFLTVLVTYIALYPQGWEKAKYDWVCRNRTTITAVLLATAGICTLVYLYMSIYYTVNLPSVLYREVIGSEYTQTAIDYQDVTGHGMTPSEIVQDFGSDVYLVYTATGIYINRAILLTSWYLFWICSIACGTLSLYFKPLSRPPSEASPVTSQFDRPSSGVG